MNNLSRTGPPRLEVIICLFLILATTGVFWPVRNHDFVNYDDTRYVNKNAKVQGGLTVKGLIWAFTTGDVSNWHPLTWISHMLDSQMHGLDPTGHHLTNVFLHAVNGGLLFLVLRFMTGAVWRSAIVSALFALHPLHVESVAWVAERKDVLSTFFWLLTMLAYTWYVKRPGFEKYLMVVAALALGLMAKPMLVTLPFVLLLLDYWPLGRFDVEVPSIGNNLKRLWRLVWEKWSLFLLSLASSIITFLVQQRGLAVQPLELIPAESRIANAFVSYASYVWKMIWPTHLAVYYPHPLESLQEWQIGAAAFFTVSISGMVLWGIRRRPYLIVGWLWYLGTLVPVIGLVQVGGQAMADRYTYVPLIGLFISFVWGISDITATRSRLKGALAVSAAVVVVIFAICTSFQLRHWKNTKTLFEHALQVTNRNQLAHNQLGLALLKEGSPEKATEHLLEALRITPQYVHAHINLGNAYKDQGEVDKAEQEYRRALRYVPSHATANNNLGILLAMRGKTDEALTLFSKVLEIDPDNARAHNNMGITLAKRGEFGKAIEHFSAALRIDPQHASARQNLKRALDRQGRN
jgi:type IV pilus biogenesis/stability protein PilW